MQNWNCIWSGKGTHLPRHWAFGRHWKKNYSGSLSFLETDRTDFGEAVCICIDILEWGHLTFCRETRTVPASPLFIHSCHPLILAAGEWRGKGRGQGAGWQLVQRQRRQEAAPWNVTGLTPLCDQAVPDLFLLTSLLGSWLLLPTSPFPRPVILHTRYITYHSLSHSVCFAHCLRSLYYTKIEQSSDTILPF